ncbi:protein involved in gliding motility GldA [Flavobacterium akiainvivens]|nr:protein involved in gliding motility GldA [Flavobacterium akiainvivens]
MILKKEVSRFIATIDFRFTIFVPNTQAMSIEVKGISKNYGAQKALDAVSFTVNKGEIVGFLGPNGAGKSTLMKILTTYITADEGEAQVNGNDVGIAQKAVQKSVGYLPEHNPLYLDLYVREYLAFNADVYKVNKVRIEEVINLTGLTPEAHKKISALSKGYRQRVGLASALLHDPEVLILDEPTTGLDPNQLVEIRDLIKNIGKDKTVFLSTHIMQEVEAICDRVIIINHGKIVTDKKLKSLVKEDKLEQVIEVEFDIATTAEALQTLPNLTDAKKLAGNNWELTFNAKEDMRPAVFDFAHDNGLKTLQLSLKNKNLETVFREMTKKK